MKYLILFLFLFPICEIKSQNDSIFCFDKQYFLDSNSTEYFKIISPQIYKNNLFYIYDQSEIKNDSCQLSLIEVSEYSNPIKTHKYKLPIFNKHPEFKDFYINDSLLILMEYNFVYFLKKDNNTDYVLFKILCSKYGNSDLKVINNDLLINCFTPKQVNNNDDILIKRINLKDFSADSFNLNSPKGIEFMLFGPRKIVDFNDKFVALANPNDYHISIYDLKSRKELFNISREISNWQYCENPLPDSVWRKQPQKFFKKVFIKYNDLSLIQKIYFIDSNRLLVIWNNKVDSLTAHINYDLWEFKSSKWELIKSKNYNLKPKQDDLFNPDTYSHFDLRNYNDLAFIVLDFPFDYKNYLNKPVSSLKKDMEIYYINNNPRLSLFQWKIK